MADVDLGGASIAVLGKGRRDADTGIGGIANDEGSRIVCFLSGCLGVLVSHRNRRPSNQSHEQCATKADSFSSFSSRG